jgi:hypothetical protein
VGFETTIPAFERANEVPALDPVATVIGRLSNIPQETESVYYNHGIMLPEATSVHNRCKTLLYISYSLLF